MSGANQRTSSPVLSGRPLRRRSIDRIDQGPDCACAISGEDGTPFNEGGGASSNKNSFDHGSWSE